MFYLAETLVVSDHEKRATDIIGNVFSGPEQQKCYFEISRRLQAIKEQLNTEVKASNQHLDSDVNTEVAVDISDEDFCETVEQLKENIRAGDIFQVVPSRTFSMIVLRR